MQLKHVLYEKIPFTKEQFFQKYVDLSANEKEHILLESGQTGRYSFAGIRPFAVITGNERKVEIKQNEKYEVIMGNPLAILEKWLQPFSFPPIPDLPDFQGGAIGYISYDYVQTIEELPNIANDDLQLPFIYFLVFDEWVVFDHEENCLWIMVLNRGNANDKLTAMKKLWNNHSTSTTTYHSISSNFKNESHVSFTEAEFVQAVKKVQNYIVEGDVFQVNLTVRQSKDIQVPSIEIYKELRDLNPSPYMGYMHTPEFQMVSGSPELLIKKAGKQLSTRPIAGTRPRGIDDEDDQRLADELIHNEKERAEHIMLVDLERNDLGKVSKFGSVHVDEFMTVEKYSHVMHIVSHVSGELAPEKTITDLIEAMFPGGTITGAPKIRTLEIIEELEPVKRGLYTGSLGWIGFNQDVHLNIIIRTMIIKDGMCHVQAGAGIVIDSNPKAEYEESLKKAAALWKAKEAADENWMVKVK